MQHIFAIISKKKRGDGRKNGKKEGRKGRKKLLKQCLLVSDDNTLQLRNNLGLLIGNM